MVSPLENGSRTLVVPSDFERSDDDRGVDPLSFVPLEIRRKIGCDWEGQVHSILYGLNLLSGMNFFSGTPAETLSFPKHPKHPNSDSHYIFQDFLGKREVKDWVGIYVLLPNETTSEHGHPLGLSEEYRILRGEMTLYEEGDARVVDAVDKFIIRPGHRHHSRTENDQFALVMVRMIGASRFPHDKMHLDSVRPEVKPEDPSPRREAIDILLNLYNQHYHDSPFDNDNARFWIKTMSYREITSTIEMARKNSQEFRQNPRYSWVTRGTFPLDGGR
ncbi:MAG: hypothetical protein HYU48_01240 [Candidatus Levybacteria bacterium]|nr:hypothetical protein [Candidatus Levybacteria bacterium]